MLIFDQLRKDEPALRALALMVLGGLGILLVGLWWVQIVSARDYQESLETQSFRTVRIPAVRGRILDSNGDVLAENRPTYNVSLYLEELQKPFDHMFSEQLLRERAKRKQETEEKEKELRRRLTREERKASLISATEKAVLRQQVRYEVASNVVMQVSQRLRQPVWLDPTNFERHYEARLVLPLAIVPNVDSTNIARFEEQSASPLGVDLEVQSTRVYPYGTLAAHLLGRLKFDNDSVEGEEAFFSYRLPDYRGILGIELGYDKELRGSAGAKSVLVNNKGYRQTENVWNPSEPGRDVVLTLDREVQRVAERALENARTTYTGPVRGAVVVMDVHSGDVVAMASSPTLNPNSFISGISHEEWARITLLQAEKNRATQMNYAPGSIFKTVIGMAALEAGLNPVEEFLVPENPNQPGKGYIVVRGRPVRDTAPPGTYNFRRALKLSSNSYFITNGLRVGPERIIRLGERLHFGERIGLPTGQEAAGAFPSLKRLSSGWMDGNTANLSIGQDPVLVTPLQVAVLMSAIANGGKVLLPRLVSRIEAHSPATGEEVSFAGGQIRDQLGVSTRTLTILREAMLADTEDADGTGRHVRDQEPLLGLRICGKTGTAQIQDVHNNKIGQTTWFASFAPYESPRWAVIVMIEDGKSGGDTCSPVAGPVYGALLKRDQRAAGKKEVLARAQ
jgi:penicillin-binding protein 2